MLSTAITTVIVIGLMSGTSMDGIEAAVIETDGIVHVKELGYASIPYHVYVHQILKATESFVRQHQGNLIAVRTEDFEKALIKHLCITMNFSEAQAIKHMQNIKQYLGLSAKTKITFDKVEKLSTDLHIKAVDKILTQCRLKPDQVRVIGYHGQTFYHNPQQRITIQVGDGQYLASNTGIAVVNDFRTKDVQAGGEGAPFAPLYHQALAVRDEKIPLAVVNCGGISNVTVIRDKNPESLIGFDPGPGNTLIDRFVQLRTHGKDTMDINGKYGRQGKINLSVLKALRQKAVWKNGQNYLSLSPPKSLDIGDLHLIPELEQLSLEDGCATLEAFTADAIVEALTYIQSPYPKHWILAGGGWYNPIIREELIRQLQDRIGKDTDIKTADQSGWNSRALEAQIFGYLAVRHLKNLPTSYPQTTGVPFPIVGGRYFTP